MPLYRFSVSMVSRGRTGLMTTRNAVAKASYDSRSPLYDERQRVMWDLTRDRHDLIHSEVLLPDGASIKWLDRERLWNEVEWAEVRRNSQVARAVTISLPRELSANDNVRLIRDFVLEQFVDLGMAADLSVHSRHTRDGQWQPHAHVLLPTRRTDGERMGAKERDWNRRELLNQWRESWANAVNRGLGAAGHAMRVSHRKLVRDVIPGIRSQAERDAAWLRPYVVRARERISQMVPRLPDEQWLRDRLPAVTRALDIGSAIEAKLTQRVPDVPAIPQEARDAAWRKPFPVRVRETVSKAVQSLANDRWLTQVLPAGVAKVREVAFGERAMQQERPEAEVVDSDSRTSRDPMDVLRERLQNPIRVAALGVAAAGWDFRETQDELVASHLLPALRDLPELEPQFYALVDRLGRALAATVVRQEARLERDASAVAGRVRAMEDYALSRRRDMDGQWTRSRERQAAIATPEPTARRRDLHAQQQLGRGQERGR